MGFSCTVGFGHNEAAYYRIVGGLFYHQTRCLICKAKITDGYFSEHCHYYHNTRVHPDSFVGTRMGGAISVSDLRCKCRICQMGKGMVRYEEAYQIAAEAHDKQLDKSGDIYFYHVRRVADAMGDSPYDADRIVAILHDVVEDTNITLEDLIHMGFNDIIIDAIWAITRQPDETYLNYIKRVKKNPIATRVKIADLRDNLERCRGILFYKLEKRYKKALEILTGEKCEESLWTKIKNSSV